MVIDGIVTGTIDMPANALTIGPKAQVDARVFARDITVHGAVSGKVTATEIVDIRDSARVSGELAAPSVKLAEGARVNARVETKRVDAAVHVARYRMARNASTDARVHARVDARVATPRDGSARKTRSSPRENPLSCRT